MEKYIFVATLDLRISSICASLDKKVFKIKAAMPGENMPPMHPWCRSTTICYIDDTTLESMNRRSPNPATRKNEIVSGTMNYDEWHNKYAKAASNAIRNTREEVYYNENNNYRIEVSRYSKKINNLFSKAAKNVAENGSKNKYEYMQLVNLSTGELMPLHTDMEYSSVGGREFWDFIEENKDQKFTFIHNHNTNGYFSETDMQTLLTTDNIQVMIAVRNDGVIYFAEKGNKKVLSIFLKICIKKK